MTTSRILLVEGSHRSAGQTGAHELEAAASRGERRLGACDQRARQALRGPGETAQQRQQEQEGGDGARHRIAGQAEDPLLADKLRGLSV